MKKKIGSSKSMKKMQKGGSPKAMSMKDLKKKYPDVDTTARGDVRGMEMNAYGPKKALEKYNDTYNAFDKKFKGGRSYKKGGSVKKYQAGGSSNFTGVTNTGGITSKIPAAGSMTKTKIKERSPDGNYITKTVTRTSPGGESSTTKKRRTVQGILRGAPSVQKYKAGGSAKSKKK